MSDVKNELDILGDNIIEDAKKNVPVKSGRLKKSLGYTVEMGSDNNFGLKLSEVEYGQYVNDGTKNQKAQPFLTNAIEKNITRGIEAITGELTEDILDPITKLNK